jgi:transposase-like protein
VQAGERTIDVATSIGVSDTSLWRWCREAGVTVRRRITAELRAEAVARVRCGASAVDVARTLEVSMAQSTTDAGQSGVVSTHR